MSEEGEGLYFHGLTGKYLQPPSVGATGLIEEANLTAANMLGVERAKLKRQLLSHFVIAEYQDALYEHCKRLLAGEGPQTFELGMRGAGDSPFYAQVKMTPAAETDRGSSKYRIAINEISECKQAELEKEQLLYDMDGRVKELRCMYGV
ncbi:MAG: hypothetical protein GY731_08765 [Gammaproteobacteria bacterium]|nr:hypothetical protein [Gammaproteobacteria bacterium]